MQGSVCTSASPNARCRRVHRPHVTMHVRPFRAGGSEGGERARNGKGCAATHLLRGMTFRGLSLRLCIEKEVAGLAIRVQNVAGLGVRCEECCRHEGVIPGAPGTLRGNRAYGLQPPSCEAGVLLPENCTSPQKPQPPKPKPPQGGGDPKTVSGSKSKKYKKFHEFRPPPPPKETVPSYAGPRGQLIGRSFGLPK